MNALFGIGSVQGRDHSNQKILLLPSPHSSIEMDFLNKPSSFPKDKVGFKTSHLWLLSKCLVMDPRRVGLRTLFDHLEGRSGMLFDKHN